MKIPELPQVEFDTFPTNESTKVCIFTQPQYPVPDLSQTLKNGRKLSLFCTETTYTTIARLEKKLPRELFKLLPNGTDWLKFNRDTVDGLDTSFGVACLPTGSVSDSVMLLILLLNDAHPKRLILYTGTFKECREVLVSDLFLKYKRKITDLYIDNTLASSKHVDAIQNMRACDSIKKIVEEYPDHKIHLQMGVFDSLDLLVDLAHRQRFHVKLGRFQQIYFYKSRFKHLFEYCNEIPNAKELNQNFRFKNRPKVHIVPIEVVDLDTYKRYFQQKKIINIRLITSEREIDFSGMQQNGVIYVSYAGHASAFTLSQLFHEIQPKRVHPIVEYELCNDSMSKIPAEILNEFCEIINEFEIDEKMPELTLLDTQPARKDVSFLNLSTVLTGTSLCEGEISDVPEDLQKSISDHLSQSREANENDDVVEVIDISDDEPITIEALCEIPRKKRTSPKSNGGTMTKLMRINEMNNNQNNREHRTRPVSENCNGNQSVTEYSAMDEYESDASDSEGVLVFPDAYD